MPLLTLLDRILWTQLARVVHASPPEWVAESASARAIRAVLAETELVPEESAILERWDEACESSRQLFDRLLQARVNRAMQEGTRIEAQQLGLKEVPRVPRVLIVREGGFDEARASVEARPSPKKTVVEFLSGASADVAALEPGAKLDQLVDLLVLANQDAAESLRSSLGPSASVVREDEAPKIDLLLAAQSPSIQVFDIERELARLEEVLRNAIPAEKRPAKSGAWSFGRDLTGELLGGKYRIRGLKGKGAFKTVYEGEDEMLGARVAVAVLNPKGARSHRALEHFQDEAKKLTTLDHENIVRWITFDRTSDALHYFVMEYLDGEELELVLRREGRLAPKRVAAILLQVLGALRRAHAKGKHGSLLHLDLKPENVFLLPPLAPGEPERVKVIDFGIGQHVGAEVRAAEHPELRTIFDLPADELGKSIGSLVLAEDDIEAPAGSSERERPGLAAPHRRVQRARGGTLLYASPEQCKHLAGHKDIAALDGRSDLYSLGVMAFRMLTGQFPFARITTAFEAIQNHIEVAPRKVGSLGIKIPRSLAAFVDRCLVKDRSKRWQDAGEAFEALNRIVHPRVSPLRVAVPVALVVALGLGALYLTREPVVSALTLVDPGIAGVSEQVVTELYLGPKNPSRRLRLESDVRWEADDAPDLRLVDATSGAPLAGWSVSWVRDTASTIELARLDGAQSAAAVLELDGGRRQEWRSGRLALRHLGPWRITSVLVPSYSPERVLDPSDRTLEILVDGDPEGRTALDSIEIRLAGELLGRVASPLAVTRGERVLYPGPGLDALATETARVVELEVLARDRAGQEETTQATLRLAGPPPDFGPDTGFVAKAARDSALLSFSGENQVLLPEDALRIEATAPARARAYLEPVNTPVFVAEIPDPAIPLVVSLAELGIAGARELPGTLRIELDDEPWADRGAPEVRGRRLAFRYTPVAPAIQVQLVAEGLERDLAEPTSVASSKAHATQAVNPNGEPRLVVRTPPGTNLWIEAACRRESGAEAAPIRMRRAGGPFELPLALPDEGPYRIVVRKYQLLAGDQRGPLIPPEHVFPLEVDRTAPRVELRLEGGLADPAGGEPLFNGRTVAQRLLTRIHEDVGLADARWTLVAPNGAPSTGTLDPATLGADAWFALPDLLAHQSADGSYRLELEAQDRAQNRAQKSAAWRVAREGPELALLAPLASGADRVWALGAERNWNVRVRATDANGVAAVRVQVVYEGRPGPELALRQAQGELWELAASDRPSAFPWWSGKELRLELTAVDSAGCETKRSEHGRVPELPRVSQLVIAPREHPHETMVEIVAGGEYVFGGRNGEGRRPWGVVLPRDALRSYYLDAREVTRAEALAFVRAADGHADPRWWPEGVAPDAARAAQLERELEGEPERSATGLAWAEAAAYAAWRGKRLPTLVEWEFAVRGAEYREGPTVGATQRHAGAPASWPSNLCAEVREWTATPERLADDGLDFPSQCRRYPGTLLAPTPDATGAIAAPASAAHWIVGAAPGEAPDWTAKALGADAPGQADVGFRCALARETALDRLDRGEYVIVD